MKRLSFRKSRMMFNWTFWFVIKLIFICILPHTCIALSANNVQMEIQKGQFLYNDLFFERYYSYDGLPDNRVRSIFQDSRGFMWIGTMNGVTVFNGYGFKQILSNDSDSLSDANVWVNDICEDKKGKIWLATHQGLIMYNPLTEKVTYFNTIINDSTVFNYNNIYTLLIDNRNQLWIGSREGIFVMNTEDYSYDSFDDKLLNVKISKIAKSHGNFIWLAGEEGVIRMNTIDKKYNHYPIPLNSSPYGDKIWSLLENSDYNLYIGTAADGILKLSYNHSSQEYDTLEDLRIFRSLLKREESLEVFSIVEHNNDLWVGTGTSIGLLKISDYKSDKPQLQFFKNKPTNNKSLSNYNVFSVFIDNSDVLWCGTELGLNKHNLNLTPFSFYSFIDEKNIDLVRAVVVDDETIFVGTAFKGMIVEDLNKGIGKYFKSENELMNRCRSLLIDDKQNLWLGTLDGLFKTKKDFSTPFLKVTDGTIYSIIQNSKGEVIFGGSEGLFKIDSGNEVIKLPSPEQTSVFVRVIHEDRTGKIWVGMDLVGGAFCYDPDNGTIISFNTKNAENRIIGNSVYSIHEYPENVFWFATSSGLSKIERIATKGVNKFSVSNYTTKDGLPVNSVLAIQNDNEGNIWISAVKGLIRYNIKENIFQEFLSDINFTQSCNAKTKNGQLIFGTTNGLIIFNPALIQTNEFPPKTVISELRLSNVPVKVNQKFNNDIILENPVSFTDEIQLSHKNNSLTLEFAALNYSNPLKNKYAYKLEGFSDEWNYPIGQEHSATFTNLDAGNYTFMVKAANNNGIWNTEPTVLNIRIKPSPWETWWAILIYILVLNIILFLVLKYFRILINEKNKIRLAETEKKQIQELNQMKLQFFTDISHEFRTPLSLIIGPAEEIIQSEDKPKGMTDKIELIYRSSKKLMYLVDELMNFRKFEQGMMKLRLSELDIIDFISDIHNNFKPIAVKKSIQFHFNSDLNKYNLWLDPQKMEIILNNLIANALKFTSQNGKVSINVRYTSRQDNELLQTNDYVEIEIKDNGLGLNDFDKKHIFDRFYQSNHKIKGTGVGLSLAKSYIDLHKGKIWLESTVGEGSSFFVAIPVGAQKYRTEIVDDLFNNTKSKRYISDFDVSVFEEDLINNASSKEHEENQIVKESDKPTLLLVDDNINLLQYLESILSDKFKLLKALNGVEAIKFLDEVDPDLIISDVMMPKMDGLELCSKIKQDIRFSHIPIVLLTAKATVENRLEGIEIGADAYIAKPFHPKIIIARINQIINSRNSLKEKLKEGKIIIPKDIAKNPLDQKLVDKVIQEIKNNMDNHEFSVEKMGKLVGMSRSNLFRKIKFLTGQTPIEFIYSIRLKYSVELLLKREYSVAEIAYMVGFLNPSSFSKSFKKVYGKSPSIYLQEIIDKNEQ